MTSVATLGASTSTEYAEVQRQIIELFEQDYAMRFDVTFNSVSPNLDHPLCRKYHRAHLILRWIMGIGSDRPERIAFEHRSLGADAQRQFEDFLYGVKDEFPELWRRRAASIYLPL
jgi:hypothetical protein